MQASRRTTVSLGPHIRAAFSPWRRQYPSHRPYSEKSSLDSTAEDDYGQVTKAETPVPASEESGEPENISSKPLPPWERPTYAYEPWTGPVPPWLRVPSFKPENIKDTDWVDLSNSYFKVDERGGSSPSFVYSSRRASPFGRAPEIAPFPPHTHGFFYWTCAQGVPGLRAEIRFRITDQKAAQWFAFGRDLLDMYGLPWRLSVLSLTAHRCFDWAVDQLLREDLLCFAEVERYRRYMEYGAVRVRIPHALQPVDAGDGALFGYDFGTSLPANAWVIGKRFVHRIGLRTFFRTDNTAPPRSGSAIFSIEPQNDPRKPRIYAYALRCHKIVEPLVYTPPSKRITFSPLLSSSEEIVALRAYLFWKSSPPGAHWWREETLPGPPHCEIDEGELVSVAGKPLLWARTYRWPPRGGQDKVGEGMDEVDEGTTGQDSVHDDGRGDADPELGTPRSTVDGGSTT